MPLHFRWHGVQMIRALLHDMQVRKSDVFVFRRPISFPHSLFYLLSIAHMYVFKLASHIQILTERIQFTPNTDTQPWFRANDSSQLISQRPLFNYKSTDLLPVHSSSFSPSFPHLCLEVFHLQCYTVRKHEHECSTSYCKQIDNAM